MDAYRDSRHRSILKAISWRVCATVTTTLIVFFLTGKLALALTTGAIEGVAKLALYYMHERGWGSISFGKKTHPLSSLLVTRALDEEDMETVKNKLTELGYIDEV